MPRWRIVLLFSRRRLIVGEVGDPEDCLHEHRDRACPKGPAHGGDRLRFESSRRARESETSRYGSFVGEPFSISETTSPTSDEKRRSVGNSTPRLDTPARTKATTASHPRELAGALRATAWPPKKEVTTRLVARIVLARVRKLPCSSACALRARTASSYARRKSGTSSEPSVLAPQDVVSLRASSRASIARSPAPNRCR